MKKILFVATVDIHIINHHLRVIHKLKEEGNQIDLASFGDYTNEDITNKYNVSFSKNPLSLGNIKAYFFMKKLLKENEYDIISCHTPLSSFFTRLAAKNTKAKVIYTAHGLHFFKGCPFINRTIYKTMEKWAAKYTDTFVTINEEDYEAIKEFKLKDGGKRVLIPGVGIDLNKINNIKNKNISKSNFGFEDDSYLMISIGEVNRNKNQKYVIDSLKNELKEDPKLHYVICGKDLMDKWLNNYVELIGLANKVHFLGYREDVLDILSVSDLFICPSYREGLPVSVMEAMALGKDIIVTNCRGNRDLIKNDINGKVVELDKEQQLLKAYHDIRDNKEKSEAFKKQNEQLIKQYSADIIDAQILDLYK